MCASTLAALQDLKDADFHALCDEILPRMYFWCVPITPHGRNERNDSVRGQPDSYVGNSAESSRVAIQCSVQRKSWWSKVVVEVREARAACPTADRIVVALPRDVDIRVLERKSVNEYLHYEGALGLASLGTPEVEHALFEMVGVADEMRIKHLICFGSRKSVTKAVEIARQPGYGVKWLVEAARFSFMLQDWSRNRFRRDVEIEPLLEYVSEEVNNPHICECLRSIIDHIDTPAVREQFARWRNLRGTSEDLKLSSPRDMMLSDIAERELMQRGDARVLSEFLEQQITNCASYRISDVVIDEFAVFDRAAALKALRTKLTEELDESRQVAALDLMGYLGESSDASELHRIVNSSTSQRVASAAFEAALRLTDPLRLADHW